MIGRAQADRQRGADGGKAEATESARPSPIPFRLQTVQTFFAYGNGASFLVPGAVGDRGKITDHQLTGGFDFGRGVNQDYQKAIKWYLKAANQGSVSAQYKLGIMYNDGEGVKQDYQQAVKWYRKAADQGDAEAQNSLGIMYGIGYGVKQNYKQAVKWYQKAAKQGSAKAKSNLGIVYLNGEGVKQNEATAKEWFGKACEDGNQIGCDNYQELNK